MARAPCFVVDDSFHWHLRGGGRSRHLDFTTQVTRQSHQRQSRLFVFVLCRGQYLFWWHDVAVQMSPGYPATLAGWWQANTVGLPDYVPTWVFLRNGMAGDLFFVLLLLLVLDRGLLWSQSHAKTAPRMA